jgi:hypothetical protein
LSVGTGQLILGTAVGYSASDVRLFLKSARLQHPGAAIVLFTERVHGWMASVAAQFGVELRQWPAAGDGASHHPTLARYFIYRSYLREQPARLVFLSDTRDVCFQGDVFASLCDHGVIGGLCVFEEDRRFRLGTEPRNASWLQAVLSGSECRRLSTQPILCSGTTAGTSAAMSAYLECMCIEIDHRSRAIGRRPYLDQALHNHVVRLDALAGDVRTYENDSSPVLTLGLCRDVLLEDGKVLSPQTRKPVAAVHQFDRVPSVHDVLIKAFGEETGVRRRWGRVTARWRTRC